MKKKVNPELNSESPRTSRQSQSLHSELKSEKRELAKLHDVPHCIKPDVSYHLGYLSGYTESASFWSFFTQWYEVMFRLDGSVRPRGPKLGPCASAGRARVPRAAHRA